MLSLFGKVKLSHVEFILTNKQIHSHHTRHSCDVHVPFTHTAQAQMLVSYEGPKFWSLLHVDNSLKSINNNEAIFIVLLQEVSQSLSLLPLLIRLINHS